MEHFELTNKSLWNVRTDQLSVHTSYTARISMISSMGSWTWIGCWWCMMMSWTLICLVHLGSTFCKLWNVKCHCRIRPFVLRHELPRCRCSLASDACKIWRGGRTAAECQVALRPGAVRAVNCRICGAVAMAEIRYNLNLKLPSSKSSTFLLFPVSAGSLRWRHGYVSMNILTSTLQLGRLLKHNADNRLVPLWQDRPLCKNGTV